MSKLFTQGWYDRVEALLALMRAQASSGTSPIPWTDVPAGTALAASLARPNLSCDSSGAQSTITLPTAAQMAAADGFQFTVKATGNMLSPVIVTAGAGTTVELLNAPGTFGAGTWLPIQGQAVVFKYDKATTQWKAWSSSEGIGSAGTAAYNPGWYAFAEIHVDPQNVSTIAKDSNSGAPGAPLRTYAEVVRRWGSSTIIADQSTNIKFLSSHTDNNDPVVLNAFNSKGATPIIQGIAPTVVTAGLVLGGVVAKNRTLGANSPLIANLGATGAVGQMVINTTAGKASRCRVTRSLGGNNFQLSQPLVPSSTTTPSTAPAEVDTWTNGDTVDLVTPIQVNIVSVGSEINDPNAGFNNVLILYQLDVFDPAGIGSSGFYMGSNVFCLEVGVERFMSSDGVGTYFRNIYTNCLFLGGAFLMGGDQLILGGAAVGIDFQICNGFTSIDGDFQSEVSFSFIGGQVVLGFVYSGSGSVVIGEQGSTATALFQTLSYGGHVMYGRAGSGLQFKGYSRGVMVSGTWVAGITAPSMVTGITLNGVATAQTHTNATPDVVTSGVATTPPNADAATGGNMMAWGGASLSKAA